jgi:hypothetical protein
MREESSSENENPVRTLVCSDFHIRLHLALQNQSERFTYMLANARKCSYKQFDTVLIGC